MSMTLLHSAWMRGMQAASIVRFKPFDVSTEEGRSKERYRRVALATLASIAARGISIVTAFISVPLTLNYLGTERYGLWITISSTIAMLAFADLGLGNGLINAISEAHGKNDRVAARRYVSSAFLMLSGIAALVLLIFAGLYPFTSWQLIFNIKSALAIQEAGPAVVVFMVCFALNMPLGVVQRVQMGYQEVFANGLWQALGSLLGLAGVILAIHLQAGLPWLVLAMSGAPVLAAFLNSLVLFVFQRPWLSPNFSSVTHSGVRDVSRIGFLFLMLQIAIAIAYQSDNIVVAQILGADQVPQYAVPMKLFSFVPMLLSFVMTPLWPAYRESLAHGDVRWIRKTLKRSLILTWVVNVPAAILLVGLGIPLMHLWAGPEITPSFLLLFGLATWVVVNGSCACLAMLFNGANLLQFELVTGILMAIANLLLSIFLTFRIGVAGVVFGTAITQLGFILFPSALLVPKLLSSVEQASQSPQVFANSEVGARFRDGFSHDL